MDIHKIYKHVCNLVLEVGEYVRTASNLGRQPIQAKENYADLVTLFDQKAEQMLISELTDTYPDHKFIGEETVSSGKKCVLTDEPTWIIDPIDGTTNFVHGFPAYAISIALFENKQAVLGFVYDIAKDVLYSAMKDQGSYCNGRPLKLTKNTELQQALIIAEFGNQRDPEFLQFKVDQMAKLIKKCHGIRCIGSAALNTCAVAAGHTDAYYEYGLHIWDMAAAYLIATEAGAVCGNPSGGPLDLLSRKFLVANNQKLADQISGVLDDFEVERD